MRRRDFIKAIAGSAAAWPIAARAQQPAKLPSVGLSVASFADVAELFLATARVLLGHEPDPRPEKSLPDRKALGSPTLATRAVANARPTPGISSSRLLASWDRCQAMIRRSNSRIWAFSARS